MIDGVKILEEVPVYDRFWMPLLYIILGLFVIATIIVTIYCYKNKWWFCDNSQRTICNKISNAMTIMLMYWVVILAGMVATLITDMILTGISKKAHQMDNYLHGERYAAEYILAFCYVFS